MEELLAKYSVSEIIIFIIILAFAIKELVTFFDWGRDRLRKVYDKDYKSMEQRKELQEEIDDLNKFYDEKKRVDNAFANIDRTFEKINKQIDMLMESDKEDIKSYIVKEHHFFVYTQGWIDDYSMECLERRFAIYRKEHGNSFVEGLMNEIRALPKQPPEIDRHKYVGTAEYVKNAKESH